MFKLSRTDRTHNPNVGHGHVYPRPDMILMRCGGPGICGKCSVDLAHAEKHEAEQRKSNTPQVWRELRLWHWNQFMQLNKVGQSWIDAGYRMSGTVYLDKASFHMKAVQTLNDLFPIGDTAEQDAAK